MTNRPTPNQFAVDYQQGDQVVDINNPKVARYGTQANPRQEYDKMLYHHDSGHVLIVSNAAQERAARAKGYKTEPSPQHDYSKLKHGRAVIADTTPNPSVPEGEVPSLSDEEMDAAEKELADYQNEPPTQEQAADPYATDVPTAELTEDARPRKKRS